MNPFEERLVSELAWLFRAGVSLHTVRITVREEMVAHLIQEPLGAEQVSGTVEAGLRAARRMVREYGAPDDLMEAVLEAALDAVRGHGGETSRWMGEATREARFLLEEFQAEGEMDSAWRRILERF